MGLLVIALIGCSDRSNQTGADTVVRPKKTPAPIVPTLPQTGSQEAQEHPPATPTASTDLSGIGAGRKRAEMIQAAIDKLSEPDLMQFLVQNQSNLEPSDFDTVSFVQRKFGSMRADVFMNGLGKVHNGPIRRFLLTQMVPRYLGGVDSDYRSAAALLPSDGLRSEFYQEVFRHKLNHIDEANISSVLGEMDAVIPEFEKSSDRTPRNELIYYSFNKLSSARREAVWANLEMTGNKLVQRLGAQALFGSMMEQDTLAASEWLAKQPQGLMRAAATDIIVSYLEGKGDVEGAAAWRKSAQAP